MTNIIGSQICTINAIIIGQSIIKALEVSMTWRRGISVLFTIERFMNTIFFSRLANMALIGFRLSKELGKKYKTFRIETHNCVCCYADCQFQRIAVVHYVACWLRFEIMVISQNFDDTHILILFIYLFFLFINYNTITNYILIVPELSNFVYVLG